MTRDDVIAFVRRDWSLVERSRLDYWADRYARDGGVPARQAATLLHEHALRIGAVMTGPHQRAADLDAHHRLRTLLDRASRALARR